MLLEGVRALCYHSPYNKATGRRSMSTKTRPYVDIGIQEPFKAQVSSPWLRKAASSALEVALRSETGGSCRLSVVITDDDTLRRLNREYRGLDEVTDVLSFSSSHNGHWEGDGEPPRNGDDVAFVLPVDEPRHLGEVVISYPQVVRQAGKGPSAVEKELGLMVAHGVLHLLGFDHGEPPEEAEMQSMERKILSSIFA